MKKSLSILLFSIFLAACTQNRGEIPEFSSNAESLQATGEGGGTFPAVTVLKQTLTYNVGPIDLPAGTTAAESMENPVTLPFQVAEPLWITGFRHKLIDSKGNPLPNSLLHKALVINEHQENPLCGDKEESGSPFAATTGEMAEIEFPSGYGYPLLPSDPLEAKVILKNSSKETDYYGIYFTFEFDAVAMDRTEEMKDVYPLLLDISACDKNLSVEPGVFEERNKTFTLPEGGSLVVAGALLSDYGVSVSLTQEKQVLPFWKAVARVDEDHKIVSLSPNPFVDPAGIQLKNDSKLTLGVAFSNASSNWLENLEGSALLYLAPEED